MILVYQATCLYISPIGRQPARHMNAARCMDAGESQLMMDEEILCYKTNIHFTDFILRCNSPFSRYLDRFTGARFIAAVDLLIVFWRTTLAGSFLLHCPSHRGKTTIYLKSSAQRVFFFCCRVANVSAQFLMFGL